MKTTTIKRTVLITVAWLSPFLLAKLCFLLLQEVNGYEFKTPLPATLLGVLQGMTYGLLSVGLVLIYRTNRIINFAHGQIGAFAAAVFGIFVVKWHVPYWMAFPVALLVAAGTGAVAEAGVVRRLRNAPRLMSVVATLGVGQFLVIFAVVVNSTASAGSQFPVPPGMPTFRFGALFVTQSYFAMLFLSPLAVVAIAIFLRRSKYGLAMRAAAANPEAARMVGIFSSRMSSLAWAIAGALSAFSAILTQPTQGFSSGDSFGPQLLLRAMTGAVIARMESLPSALAAGVGLGVIEQWLLLNYARSGLVELALFVLILATLLLQKQRGGRDEEKGSWAAVEALRPLPQAVRDIWLVRNLGRLTGLVALAFAATLPMFITHSKSATWITIMGFAVVGLSVGILTGLGGQLTLGQFAVGAMGGVVSYYVSSRTGNFALSIFYGGVVAGAVCVVLGLPGLRVRGLMLTVTTLSFALVTQAFLLGELLGTGQDPGRPVVFGQRLDSGKEYYYFALVLTVIAFLLAANVRRSGFGRLLVAVRDNEDNARAFTVRASLVKVQGYLIGGFLAGVGGALYTHALSNIGSQTFLTKASIDAVVMTVIGGVSLLAGPLIGALLVIGLPAGLFGFQLDSLGLAATALGQLLLVLYLPGGLGQAAGPIRLRLAKLIVRAKGLDVDAMFATDDEAIPADGDESVGIAARIEAAGLPVTKRRQRGFGPLLEARELRKSFGGVHAVQGVSLDVLSGETVGLIGPNGAGKTTTFELLSGFTKLDAGSVHFDGHDVTLEGPESRGQRGMIRSFQDAALFPTMTVTECVMLALERTQPTAFLGSVLGITRGELRKREEARAVVSMLGLDRYRDKQVRELSTGTRRIAEIACLVALRPTLLLLDEPSSGIAQRETEALGSLLTDLKRQFGLTLLIIEHDIPLIMSISDRIVAMADGVVIASGTPEFVRNDAAVIEAYLGGSLAAIERSGKAAAMVGAKR